MPLELLPSGQGGARAVVNVNSHLRKEAHVYLSSARKVLQPKALHPDLSSVL